MIKTFIVTVSCRVLVIVWLAALCLGGHGPLAVNAASSAPATASVAIWRGGSGDPRWSNPANWEGGSVPRAADQVRLPSGTGDSLVDAAFAGRVVSITLDEGYANTLTVARALDVQGTLSVNGGTVAGGADVLNVETLTIAQGAIVRMGANGKLNLTGDGSPLSGDGLLDTKTNTPNSVEYTGKATSDLTAAVPMAAFHGINNNATQDQRTDSAMTNELVRSAPSLTETGRLTLTAGENNLGGAVIDTANGFAYFGADTIPGLVVKVRLSDFTRVGVLTLNPEEYNPFTAVIDTANGFAYFGTYTSPGRVTKVRLSDFTRVGGLSLNAGEDQLSSSVIDTTNGFAYFGTFSQPSFVVKVRLSDLARIDALTLNVGEKRAGTAAIDIANGFAYFVATGYATSVPGTLVKIRLSDFIALDALTFNVGEGNNFCAVIDSSNGFAYFCASAYPTGKVVKIRLSDLSRVGALTFNPGENMPYSAVIDTANGFAYFGTMTQPGIVVKVQLTDFTRVGALTWWPNDIVVLLRSAVIDIGNGFAYFGTGTFPGIVVKVDLASLILVKSASTIAVSNGDLLTYTLTVTDASPDTATGLTLSDTLPAGVTFLSASAGCSPAGSVIVCSLGSLTPGSSTQAFIQVQVTSTVLEFVTNTARVSASEERLSELVSASVTTLLNPLRRYLPQVGR